MDHYSELIPYSVLREWLQTTTKRLSARNQREMKLAVNRHCAKHRVMPSAEKKKIALKVQQCLLRILSFWREQYDDDALNLKELCCDQSLHIVGDQDVGFKPNSHRRTASNHGQTITIENDTESSSPSITTSNRNGNGKEEMDEDSEQRLHLNHAQIRRLNERSLRVYWDGLKSFGISLQSDYQELVEKLVLTEIKGIISYFYELLHGHGLSAEMAVKERKFMRLIPFSKVLYIVTDIYAMLVRQRATYNRWTVAMKPILEMIRQISWIYFKFDLHRISRESALYDVDEFEGKEMCFTKLFKRFLIHALKNGADLHLKFKDVLKKLVLREPFIWFLFEEEEFVENVLFRQITLSSVLQTEMARKLQAANVHKRAQWEARYAQQHKEEFKPKFTRFIRETLGIQNESDHSLLMDIPI